MMTLITLNVRYDNPNDGDHGWSRRRQRVADFLRERQPDWIALQEVMPGQRAFLETQLPNYRSYGVSRDGRGRDEQCCWMVRDPWWFEEATTVWLSETPDQVSRGWDACLPRVASLVRISGPVVCYAANLHLDHVGAVARQKGFEMVAQRLREQGQGALVAGDFNEDIPQLEGWTDCQLAAGQGQRGTFHDFRGGSSGPRIDAILLSPQWRMNRFELIEDATLSDHYPLWVELEAASSAS